MNLHLMKRKKLPYIIRLIRHYLNCLWYHLLFPLGTDEDEFQKGFKEKNN